MDARIVQVTSTVGASTNTVRQWVSLQDKGAQNYICTWHPIVKGMTWADCKKHFRSDWLDAYKQTSKRTGYGLKELRTPTIQSNKSYRRFTN